MNWQILDSPIRTMVEPDGKQFWIVPTEHSDVCFIVYVWRIDREGNPEAYEVGRARSLDDAQNLAALQSQAIALQDQMDELGDRADLIDISEDEEGGEQVERQPEEILV